MNPLRIWWIPQIPGKSFEVEVANLVEAKLLLDVLARYDNFQFQHNIKPDYSNAGGVQEKDPNDGWVDWYPDEKVQAILDQLYPRMVGDSPLDVLTLDQVRQLQEMIDG